MNYVGFGLAINCYDETVQHLQTNIFSSSTTADLSLHKFLLVLLSELAP